MQTRVYIGTDGRLERRQNTLAFVSGEDTRYLPVEATGSIHLFAHADLNSSVLNFLGRNRIPLHVYNHYGQWTGSFVPREQNASGKMLLSQAGAYTDAAERLSLARRFVQGSLANALRVLTYYSRRGHEVSPAVSAVSLSLEASASAGSVEALMAAEGHAREEYYRAWNQIFLSRDFEFDRRTRRPPESEVNALISFGNTLLYTTVLTLLHGTKLDPRIGFLHAANDRAFSLNLDVAEVFKPLVVDRVIFSLVNRQALRKEQFRRVGKGVFLDDDGRRIFLSAYEERLAETIHDARARRSVSYRGLIELELYKLERHLEGEEPYSPYVSEW